MKRQHQKECEEIVSGIIAGSGVREIIAHVTPGGGKSTMPIIAGRLIDAGLADAMCWVCPRTALQTQGAQGFVDPFFRDMFGHKKLIRSSTNEIDPSRGLAGFSTTYQAIGVDENQTVLQEFKKRRYILILDEFHHLELDGIWHKALKPIIEQAAFVVAMTGSIERGDEKQIAILKYKGISKKKWAPVTESSGSTVFMRYTRADALREHAIIPMKIHAHDGHAKWKNSRGIEHKASSLAKACDKDVAPALYTALSTDYAKELLNLAVPHWQAHRRINPRAKLLVVCANKKNADLAFAHMRSIGIQADIATSHDSEKALAAIKRFKGPGLHVLITIAMAYEGLDCPPITHIACLTHIRTATWIEQMLARSTRFDREAGPYESQIAHIFAPDDALFRQIVNKIMAEQNSMARGLQQAPLSLGLEMPGDDGAKKRVGITPLESGICGMKREMMVGREIIPTIKTPDEEEKELREVIEKHVSIFAFNNRYKPQHINSQLRARFGKPRAEMTLPELREVFRFCQTEYPTGRPVRGSGHQRVPNKAVAWNG